MLTKKLVGLVLGAALTTAAYGGEWFRGSHQNASLGRAHKAFLSGNLRAMTTNIKKALMEPNLSEVEKKNALGLLEQANVINNGNVPTDWRLPDEIISARISVHRRENVDGVVRRFIEIKGDTKTVSPIEQLQIIRYPNDVVIDKLNAVGEWEEEIESDGSPHFKGQAKKAEARVPAGLYLLNIVLKDGTRTDGWFALDDDMNASTSPKLYQPTAHQELQSNHPVIKFEEYRSPEYKPYEKRSVIAHVETPEWQTLWWGGFNYPDDEIATSLTLGSENSDHQTYDFADGKYWLGFGFRESHRFGDLKIMRVSKISRPFKVKGGK